MPPAATRLIRGIQMFRVSVTHKAVTAGRRQIATVPLKIVRSTHSAVHQRPGATNTDCAIAVGGSKCSRHESVDVG